MNAARSLGPARSAPSPPQLRVGPTCLALRPVATRHREPTRDHLLRELVTSTFSPESGSLDASPRWVRSVTGEAENLEAKVVNWLKRTGLPLELSIQNAFKMDSFKVRHSEPYRDPETNKAREIDVIASLYDDTSHASVHYVVECKASPHPWVVVSSSSNTLHRRSAQDLGLRSDNLAYLEPGLRWKADEASHLDHVVPAGHILKQAFSENVDPGYAASISVMKAARSMINAHPNRTEYVFAIPVIVVDSPLFHCSVNSKGMFSITQCDFVAYSASVYIPQPEEAIVRVATRAGAEKLVGHCRKQATAIFAVVEQLKAAKWKTGQDAPLGDP